MANLTPERLMASDHDLQQRTKGTPQPYRPPLR